MELTKEQQEVVDAALRGENIYLYGGAGTGKSYTLNKIVNELKDAGKKVVITAPTGVAAINVHGVTINKAFGLGIKPSPNSHIISTQTVIREADVIIVDEISMVRRDRFDYIGNTVNRLNKQLIVVGDFAQLPPIITPKDKEVLSKAYKVSELKTAYAFESVQWERLNFKPYQLTESIRQNNDATLAENLNKIRLGDTNALPYLNTLVSDEDETAITICATNKEADNINNKQLESLDTEEVTINGRVIGTFKENNYPVPTELKLKVGADVVICVNDPKSDKYQNGSRGKIVSFNDRGGVIVELYGDGNHVLIEPYEWEDIEYVYDEITDSIEEITKGSYIQLPLKLGWAVTIHKSQGQTYENVNVSLQRIWESGQAYVALSRATTAKGLHLLNSINASQIIVDNKVINFYKGLSQPIVEHTEEDISALKNKIENCLTEFDTLTEETLHKIVQLVKG